jgi:hypothetical protein
VIWAHESINDSILPGVKKTAVIATEICSDAIKIVSSQAGNAEFE